MKVQLCLVALLAAAALSAPLEMIDPDCIEEEVELAEPAPEIDAEFAINVPDLRLDFGNNVDDECEDDVVPTVPPVETEAECEDDPIVTEPPPTEAPAPPAAEECEDEPLVENVPEPVVTAPPPEPSGTEECVDEDW